MDQRALTPEPNGNGDGAGGVGGDPPGDSESTCSCSSSFSTSDSRDNLLQPYPPPGGTAYSEPPALPPALPPHPPRAPNSAKKHMIDLPYKFMGDPTHSSESYNHKITVENCYITYFKDDHNADDDKIIFIGSIV
jgi:hypothetical protein